MKIDATLYWVSDQRIARLSKQLDLPVLPRTGEFIKIRNQVLGDYFAFEVTEVTHREGRIPEIRLRINYHPGDDLPDDQSLESDINTYVAEGWFLESLKKKTC